MSPAEIAARRQRFRELHQSGCFVIPNPWDIGSALYLRHLGFQALATTSSGFAFSRGLPDRAGAVTREMALGHVAEIAAAVDLPVSADFESGYAPDAEGVAESVGLCAAAGAAGLSIEDSTEDRSRPLYELPLAVERILAARQGLEGTGVVLTARAECFLRGHPDPLRESIRRLQAYAEAGADVLYAPGLHDRAEIQTVVDAVSPKPVNVLATPALGLGVNDLAALGVRRISVGSGLARAAWTAFLRAARVISETGSFAELRDSVSGGALNEFFAGQATLRAKPS
jgi:2-methylisocitrate lyase-like PEP mutase family enzyme